MTTIAYRDGILAGDGRAMISGWIVGENEEKIVRLPDGRLLGWTGEWASISLFKEWLAGGEEGACPELGDRSRGILISGLRRIRIYEGKGWYDESSPFCAWGSGAPPALGALHAGASAVEAVKAAAKVDPSTGGRIRFLSWEGKK